MRQIFYAFTLIISSPEMLCSQFGFAGEFRFAGFEESASADLMSPNSNDFYAIGPVYTFRLKRKRMEFFPALMAGFGQLNYGESNIQYDELDFSFRLPIAIYPFDFNNDCNCPTFNKQGEAFRKGFYLLMMPAIHYYIKSKDKSPDNASHHSTAYSGSLGIGIDFALSRTSTLSPNIQFFRIFGDRYNHDSISGEIGALKGSRTGLALNIRYMWYQKKRR